MFRIAYEINSDLFQQDDCGDLTRFSDDPVGFAREILGVRLWRAQKEILESLVSHDRVSVRSAHGIGKSFLAAVAVLWGLLCHENSIVVTTAPVWDQVEGIIWPEIHSLVQKARYKLPGTLLQTEYRLGPKWRAFGRSTNQPERFAGIHATPIHSADWELTEDEFWSKVPDEIKDSSFLLLIVDEASGVEEKIYEAAAGFMTTRGSKVLLTGNPTQPSGTFYNSHQPLKWDDWKGNERIKKAIEWKTFHVSAFDVIREAPRLYDPNYVERARHDWGEGSPMWKVRVVGDFPDDGPDILFPLHSLQECKFRTHDKAGRLLIGKEVDKDGNFIVRIEFGIDIGAQGTGETVVYLRRGQFVEGFFAWREPDTLKTTKKIKDLIHLYHPSVVRLDRGSFGKAICDSLSAVNWQSTTIVGVDFGGSADDKQNYARKRDEMFFKVAQQVRLGEISGLKDEITVAQMSDIRHKLSRDNKEVVESKDEMEKRGRKSPDRADAFVLCFHVPVRQGSDVSKERNVLTSDPRKEHATTTGISLTRKDPW